MRTIVVPFGETGWRERTVLFEGFLARRPGTPLLFDDLLILVPSSRIGRAYGKVFLSLAERRFGSRAIVQPLVQTLSRFLQQVASRSCGLRIIDENARLVLLEGLVKERMGRDGSFGRNADILAPSLSAAAAEMIEGLAAAAVTPERLRSIASDRELTDRPQVRMLLDVYERYEAALAEQGFVDPAGMLRSLHERFDPAWFGAYSAVVIDGIHGAGPMEAQVLSDMASLPQSLVIVDAPSPEAIQAAGTYHPLRPLKDLLARLQASSLDARGAQTAADRFLAGALFAERSFEEAAEGAPADAGSGKTVRLCSAMSARDEVSFIAREIKSSLLGGRSPDAVLAAFPSLDEYGPLVEEIFTDFGIPYNRALGRQLSSSPVATAVVSLLRACQEDFSAPSLQRVLSSPFLKFAEQPSLAPLLDRFLRNSGIVGGRERILSALKHSRPGESEANLLAGPLTDLFAALATFAVPQAAPLSAWMERLETLLSWSGLAGRVALIKGPLNTNLQAFRKLMDTIASLRAAGRLFPAYRYTFSEWSFLLRKTLMHVRFQVPPDDEGGVQVLGMAETAGHAWKEIYLGGLVDGKFPQRLPQNIFLPEATLEALGVRTLEQARLAASFHFYRLLQSAPTVVLTRPENIGDKPVVPSPFLEELAPLRKAGMLKERQAIQFSFEIKDCGSVPELAKALALAGEATGRDDLLALDLPGMDGIRSAVLRRPPESTAFPAPEAARVFRVTELEEYLRCPYDYYVRNVLGVEPLEEPTEDISALDRGSKIHSILRRFYAAWDGPVTTERRPEALTMLHQLAEEWFRAEADTFRNRREKELFLTVMAERFIDAEILFWQQGMRPAYLEQKIEGFTLSLADGSTVELHAKIDRIDTDRDGNFVIVDYKTGKYPQPRNGTDQEIFQLPVYAIMARSMAAQGPTLRRSVGLCYYDLSGRFGSVVRDMALYDRDAMGEQAATKPQSSRKSASEFERILSASVDKARRAIEGILRGDFPSVPGDENQCRYCVNEVMCRTGIRDLSDRNGKTI